MFPAHVHPDFHQSPTYGPITETALWKVVGAKRPVIAEATQQRYEVIGLSEALGRLADETAG
jgi:hypothetical protein